ncbi:hypothetical protein VTJ04DRAFT_9068 [Mycothermus thermophilus]|uniref:uncharacterized protein n=1 Tax=Humicola insolens TaxID=85995 RepID=UPI003742129E
MTSLSDARNALRPFDTHSPNTSLPHRSTGQVMLRSTEDGLPLSAVLPSIEGLVGYLLRKLLARVERDH